MVLSVSSGRACTHCRVLPNCRFHSKTLMRVFLRTCDTLKQSVLFNINFLSSIAKKEFVAKVTKFHCSVHYYCVLIEGLHAYGTQQLQTEFVKPHGNTAAFQQVCPVSCMATPLSLNCTHPLGSLLHLAK